MTIKIYEALDIINIHVSEGGGNSTKSVISD